MNPNLGAGVVFTGTRVKREQHILREEVKMIVSCSLLSVKGWEVKEKDRAWAELRYRRWPLFHWHPLFSHSPNQLPSGNIVYMPFIWLDYAGFTRMQSWRFFCLNSVNENDATCLKSENVCIWNSDKIWDRKSSPRSVRTKTMSRVCRPLFRFARLSGCTGLDFTLHPCIAINKKQQMRD